MSLLRSSLQEINEIVLITASYTLNVPSSSDEYIESLAHSYGKAPFFTYMISFDNVTFTDWPLGHVGGSTNNYALYMYTDNRKIYFHYLYQFPPSSVVAFPIYIKYKLYLTEVVT